MLINREESCIVLIDVQEKLTPLVQDSKSLVARAHWFLSLARDLHIPTIVCEQYPQGLGSTVQALQGFGEAYSKVHFSCFEESAVRSYIAAQYKKQVLLIGIETHVCVLQSALGFLRDGYEVFVAVDAVSARSPIDHEYGLKRMASAGVALVTGEMVFFEWVKQAGTPEFKSLSSIYLRK